MSRSKTGSILKSQYQLWGFTLRKTKDPQKVTQSDYKLHLFTNINCEAAKVQNHVFETKGGLHMHGIITIHRKFKKQYLRVRGWRFDLVEIYDRAGWLFYTSKQNTPTTVSTTAHLEEYPQRDDEPLTPVEGRTIIYKKKLFSKTSV